MDTRDSMFELPLCTIFVGLIPKDSGHTAIKVLLGDPTTPSSWEGCAAHIASKKQDYDPLLDRDPLTAEQPSARRYAPRDFVHLMQYFVPGTERTSATFSEARFFAPVKGMVAQVPTLDSMFTDAPRDGLRYANVATLLNWNGAKYTLSAVDVDRGDTMDLPY